MTLTRRELLLAGASLPGMEWLAGQISEVSGQRSDIGPPTSDLRSSDDAWERLTQQFVIEGMHLNTGTYGACPLPVLEATIQNLRAFERILGQEAVDLPALKLELEAMLGAWPGSIAILRNTTEAMNVVANGIDLKRGDEVLSTTHEHIGGRCCWELLAKRRGIVYKRFAPPLDPTDDGEFDAWKKQVTNRTKVLSISQILFSTGLIQPVRELVRWARSRGIVSVIDGAHPPGMLALNLRDIDADFYATSPHKWLLAPKGTGLLIARPDRWTTTWPLIGSGDWEAPDMRRFEDVGTSNTALAAGLRAAVAFQRQIGPQVIEDRVRSLATTLDAALRTVPKVHVVSPSRATHRSAMVSFTMEGKTAEQLQGILGRERIRTRWIKEFDLHYLRLSTHIYVLPRDLDRVVDVLRTAART